MQCTFSKLSIWTTHHKLPDGRDGKERSGHVARAGTDVAICRRDRLLRGHVGARSKTASGNGRIPAQASGVAADVAAIVVR